MIDDETKFARWAAAGLFVVLAFAGGAIAAPSTDNVAYRDGDTQGCASGYSDARRDGYQHQFSRDMARYAGDAEYRKGWDEGHARCYEDEQRHPRLHGDN